MKLTMLTISHTSYIGNSLFCLKIKNKNLIVEVCMCFPCKKRYRDRERGYVYVIERKKQRKRV